MSEIFTKIKKDSIKFRKEKSRYAGELNYIISKINDANKALTKDGITPSVSDSICIQELRSYAKQQSQLYDAIKESDDEFSKEMCLDNLRFVKEYLPEDISEEQIKDDIKNIIDTLDDKSPKQMGVVIKTLKQKYGDKFNGAVISPLVKSYLN